MHRSAHIASALGGASTLLMVVASALVAQAATGTVQTAEILGQMRTDLSARRYAAVISGANGLLESARAITTPQRIELFQLVAAAYYPDAPGAQKPDSARLPLTALIRLAPDIKIAREFSWPGLDELTEHTRANSFAVVSRPPSEYTLSERTTGRLAVVASRPTRFLLQSVDASGRTVIHDSSAYVTSAALQLRTHDARGPIFTDGMHQLHIWAYDLRSGDSVRIAHRVRALRRDQPAPVTEADAPVVNALSTSPVVKPAIRQVATTHRSSLLWGGLALAAATVLIAQEARPDDGFRTAFRVDGRAFVVGAVMATAAVTNFVTGRAPASPALPNIAVRAETTEAPLQEPMDIYHVRLQIDPPER